MNDKGAEGRVRIAIIGLGMGAYHLDVLLENPRAKVSMLCDLREEYAREVAEEKGVPNVCTDYADVVADPEIDAAHQSTGAE